MRWGSEQVGAGRGVARGSEWVAGMLAGYRLVGGCLGKRASRNVRGFLGRAMGGLMG